MLEIPCGQQDHTFVLYNPAAGFPFSGNSLFWKSSAKAVRLIYVTNRNQKPLIATFHKQTTAPRHSVWRWLMLPPPSPTAPSGCDQPRARRLDTPGCAPRGELPGGAGYPTCESPFWDHWCRKRSKMVLGSRGIQQSNRCGGLKENNNKPPPPATWEGKPRGHTLRLFLQSDVCGP